MMTSRRLPILSVAAALCLGVSAAGTASATEVKATLQNGEDLNFLAAAGSFGVRAYSQQNGLTPDHNATVTPNVVVGGATITPIAGPVFGAGAPAFPAYYVLPNGGPGIPVPTGMLTPPNNLNGKRNPIYTNLGPSATLLVNSDSGGNGGSSGPNLFNKGRWLPTDGDQVTITSVTGQYMGQGSAYNTGGVRVLSASADAGALPPPAGAAAGLAFDPFTISSPVAYAPSLTGSVQADTPGLVAGATYWATDSSVFTSDVVDNFTADGTPLDDSLWYLAIDEAGGIESASQANVDFVLNPAALNEIIFPSSFIAGLGPFSDPTTEAALIDTAIDANVEDALSLTGGTLSLSSGFDPFPSGTEFSPADGGVSYGDGVEAGVEAPEPGSIWLLLPGLALAFALRRRVASTRTA